MCVPQARNPMWSIHSRVRSTISIAFHYLIVRSNLHVLFNFLGTMHGLLSEPTPFYHTQHIIYIQLMTFTLKSIHTRGTRFALCRPYICYVIKDWAWEQRWRWRIVPLFIFFDQSDRRVGSIRSECLFFSSCFFFFFFCSYTFFIVRRRIFPHIMNK